MRRWFIKGDFAVNDSDGCVSAMVNLRKDCIWCVVLFVCNYVDFFTDVH